MEERKERPIAKKLKLLEKTEIFEEELTQAILNLFTDAPVSVSPGGRFLVRACQIHLRLLSEAGIITDGNTLGRIVSQLLHSGKIAVLEFDGHGGSHVCVILRLKN